MDKLLEKNWFVILVSFIVALMLYAIVGLPKNIGQNADGTSSRVTNGEEVFENVPLTTYYDEDHYIVFGLPETVSIVLKGSTTQVFMAKLEKSFEVYADLEDLDVGTHTVFLKHRGLSEELEVSIEPAAISVTIEEKVSQDFAIQIDYINEEDLPSGMSVQEAIVTPTTVSISGSTRQLNEIASVKGVVDLKGAKETFTTKVPLTIYDSNGNEMVDLPITPKIIDVEVPIVEPHKTVPIKINQENDLSEGIRIKTLRSEPEVVTIYGPEEVLSSVEFVELSIDLQEISEEETVSLDVDVPLPKGSKSVDPNQVQIVIEMEQDGQDN